MAKKPAKCPNCGAEGTLYGPEPYTCSVCDYVVTQTEEGDDG